MPGCRGSTSLPPIRWRRSVGAGSCSRPMTAAWSSSIRRMISRRCRKSRPTSTDRHGAGPGSMDRRVQHPQGVGDIGATGPTQVFLAVDASADRHAIVAIELVDRVDAGIARGRLPDDPGAGVADAIGPRVAFDAPFLGGDAAVAALLFRL